MGFWEWLTGSNTSTKSDDVSTAKNEVVVVKETDNTPSNMPVKKSIDNFAMLKANREYIQQAVPNGSTHVLMTCLHEPLITGYDRLVQFSNRDQRNESPETFLEIINLVSITDIRREMEIGYTKVAQWPIDLFREILYERIIPAHNEQRLSQLMPSESECNAEKSNIQVALRQCATGFMYELEELRVMQNQLQQMKPQMITIIEETSSTDWGGWAKNIGVGAIAFANPVIGIPLAIANYFNVDKQCKQKEQFIEQFFTAYTNYLQKWDNLIAQQESVTKQQESYYVQKCSSMLTSGIMNVLKVLDEQGHCIKQPGNYFS